MYVDFIVTADTSVTQTAAILYLELTGDPATVYGFVEAQMNGAAPFGADTGGYRQLRELFTVRMTQGSGYTWSRIPFVKSAMAVTPHWLCRLQQDQHLDPSNWSKGPGHTATFGASNQFDMLTSDTQYITIHCETLCNQRDVEEILMSGLQGRIKFSSTVDTEQGLPEVMTEDWLWELIYRESRYVEGRLTRYYETPLVAANESDRGVIRNMVAKRVAVEVLRRFSWNDIRPQTVGLLTGWIDETEEFLKNPALISVTRQEGGTSFTVVRG